MATFKHTSGKRFLFVHIPRTGGRFIEVNLGKNGWEYEPIELYGIPHYHHSFIEDCEIAHFHKDLYEKYCDVDGIEQIVVVRNPIDRFFSASTYFMQVYEPDIQEKLEDDFVNIIDNFPYSETRNWWRPQVDFITDTTHDWMFENGLGTDFGNWMSEKLEVPFEIDEDVKYAKNQLEGKFRLKRTPKLVENIKKYYNEDIERYYANI